MLCVRGWLCRWTTLPLVVVYSKIYVENEASRGTSSHCVSGPTCVAQVHIVWNLRSSCDEESGGGLLQVTPLEADVQAGESLPFRVGLFPSKGNCYFAEEAEAFVSPANQMSFR